MICSHVCRLYGMLSQDQVSKSWRLYYIAIIDVIGLQILNLFPLFALSSFQGKNKHIIGISVRPGYRPRFSSQVNETVSQLQQKQNRLTRDRTVAAKSRHRPCLHYRWLFGRCVLLPWHVLSWRPSPLICSTTPPPPFFLSPSPAIEPSKQLNLISPR